MHKKTLLVGNDINNIVPNNSWNDLLNDIVKFCNAQNLVTNFKNKPFPLLYEEIFLKSLREPNRNEKDLKKFISEKVSEIGTNEIHRRIQSFDTKDIITTNYEFTLEGQSVESNSGVIDERLYSIFRHYKVGTKNYWHIHGDCRTPNSITLGFEHYGGQLQQIRNYVVTGTNYRSKKISKFPLIKRIGTSEFNGQSWIELFFTSDIYIFGLAFDYVETDLWWLLTYRARQIFYKKKSNIKNKIFYFIPKEIQPKSKEKLDLLNANGVTVIDTLSTNNNLLNYYNHVLDRIEKGSR